MTLRCASPSRRWAAQRLNLLFTSSHDSGNADMTQRLAKVVEVVDVATGTVRLKRDVSKVATATAPEVGLHPGSARSALKAAVVAAQAGSTS